MYEEIFKLALDTVDSHGSFDDFVRAVPSHWMRDLTVARRRIIWEMAEYTIKVWLRE